MSRKLTIFTLGLFLVVWLVAGAACGGSKETESPLTAAEIIAKASQKMQGSNYFHFVLEQVGGGTPIAGGLEMTKAVGDIASPDKLKMTVSGSWGGMFLQVQMINVSEVMYMTNPLSGKWELLPTEFRALSMFDPNSGVAAIMRGVTALTRLDDEAVEGVLAYHLKGEIDSGDLRPITGSSVEGVAIATDVWVGKEDFLVRRIKLDGKITETEVPGIVRVLTLSNFDVPVNIALPQ